MSQSSEAPPSAAHGGEIMLFGVRVKVDPMRKSVSMNNLSEYEPLVNNDNNPNNNVNEAPKAAADDDGAAAGYASADDAVPQPLNGNRERKRGVPWSEEEHKLFLIGLQKVGRGDWRGISRNYVKTRTPTQVASHAQKYFLRRSNLNRRRRRSSLFDITTESVTAMPIEEGKSHQESMASNINGFSVMPFPVTASAVLFPMQSGTPMENSGLGQIDLAKNSSPMLSLKQEVPIESSQLSLRLSLSSGQDQPSTMGSSFQMMMTSFNNGDSGISVA